MLPLDGLAQNARGDSGDRAKVSRITVGDIPLNDELLTEFKDRYKRESFYELHGHQTPAAVGVQRIRRDGGMSARRPEFEPHNRFRIEDLAGGCYLPITRQDLRRGFAVSTVSTNIRGGTGGAYETV
jgi:hypothetical protein